MGGKSSSSSSNQTTNVSGQTAISGDNLGTNLSGVNNSEINITATDHGAVKGALDLGGEIIEAGENMFLGGVEMVQNSHEINSALVRDAHNTNTDFLSSTHELNTMFAAHALDEYSSTNSENLSMIAGLAGNQAAQNSANLSSMMELAKFKQDGGKSESDTKQIVLIVVVCLVLGLVSYGAVSKK
ncbi:chemotaxis protein [Vibrio astriarenae]|uniref:Chemotaxis protein n=1 Tax=Vibrio astriarenae TaxID=1481923 RepID=A0A7Z2T2V4_9VIBR|nr:chemotaxis protein [Vibrio astriarenae]QIA63336.1 chemotaxis protein [Vibrio astriarenae]